MSDEFPIGPLAHFPLGGSPLDYISFGAICVPKISDVIVGLSAYNGYILDVVRCAESSLQSTPSAPSLLNDPGAPSLPSTSSIGSSPSTLSVPSPQVLQVLRLGHSEKSECFQPSKCAPGIQGVLAEGLARVVTFRCQEYCDRVTSSEAKSSGLDNVKGTAVAQCATFTTVRLRARRVTNGAATI